MFKVIEYVLLFVCKEVIFLNIKLMKCMCSYVRVNVIYMNLYEFKVYNKFFEIIGIKVISKV